MSKYSEYAAEYCKISEYYIRIVREQMFVRIRSPVPESEADP